MTTSDAESETEEQRTKRLRRFVLDFCDGRIFTDRHLGRIEDLRMVFMPLALMGRDQLEELAKSDPALFYEHIDKAGPQSINGMPCFFSVRTLSRADWERVAPAIASEIERRKGIEL